METINFQMLASLANAARRCDIDLNEVMQALQLDIDMSGDPRRRMSLPCFSALFKAVEARKPKHHFPLVFGDSFNFDGLPELATFVTSASTPQEAMQVLDWAPKLLHPNLQFETRIQGPEVALEVKVMDPAGVYNDLPGFVESTMAAVLKFVRLLSPQGSLVRRVEFRHAPMAAVSEYEQLLQADVLFSRPLNRLITNASALDVPLPGGIPSAHLKAQAVILNRLLPEVEETTLDRRIRRLLKSRLSLLAEPLDTICSELNIHPRTLQRHLKESGSSYGDVLNQVRHELAIEMLKGSVMDMETIASKLGYSDRRSFTSAFQRWQGISPREFRNQNSTAAS
ncbi:MAG TPA: AraC family transcriptional regulator ligand-binding domain-containing protein [Limnobacter sp.]|uniref:AraC family transcriptional regulator n=1 Tax=Limnobacter sp. TaxID=2003368 RepID=UPI002EDA9216